MLSHRVADELEARASSAGRMSDLYDDPVAWAAVALPMVSLTPYQAEVLRRLGGMVDGVRMPMSLVTVRGPRGLGKTALTAVAILWFATTREARGIDWKMITTAGSWYQLKAFLWPEVHKWARRIDWKALGVEQWRTDTELLKLGISLSNGAASSASPERAELIEGAHATEVFCIYEESKQIPAETFAAIEGVFSGVGAATDMRGFALAVSTPGAPAGAFYDIHSRKPGYGDWWVRHVTIDEAIAAGQVTVEWRDRMAEAWGTDSALFANHVLGEFRADDENSVIPLAWIEAAVERWREWRASGRPAPHGLVAGVDVARHGGDRSIIVPLFAEQIVPEIIALPRQDTMETASDVAKLLRQHGGRAVVDADGMGAGVADALRHQGFNAEAFHGAPRPEWKDRSGELEAFNRRSAAWWSLRERLDPRFSPVLALPDDPMLIGDMTAPRLVPDMSGRIKLERKEQTKARLHRSPDAGDALAYAGWREPLGAGPVEEWVSETGWSGGSITRP